MNNLNLNDFISDYQHMIVRGDSKEKILDHIENFYLHIKEKCLKYIDTK